MSHLLVDWIHKGALRKSVAISFIVCFIAGNSINTARLFLYGRGAYQEGLNYILNNKAGTETTISSDNDFRNRMVIEHYKSIMSAIDKIEYVKKKNIPPGGTEWAILHKIGKMGDVSDHIEDLYGNTYILRKILPYSDLSGWHWFIYRRQ